MKKSGSRSVGSGLKIVGGYTPPPDKSISHRAAIFAGLADGKSRIRHFLNAADTMATVSCMAQMGVGVKTEGDGLVIHGRGLHGLRAPRKNLDAKNSGTTMRLLSGLLAGQKFNSVLVGDESLTARPMKRIIEPLRKMGANIEAVNDEYSPLELTGSRLFGINYKSPVASAQVKSCVLLAGLYADGPTTVTEPSASRDHTERMLPAFGGRVERRGLSASVRPNPRLHPLEMSVPGDISSSAFFIAAAAVLPGSRLVVKGVGLNPGRVGFLKCLEKMSAKVTVIGERTEAGEPVGDLEVLPSHLCAFKIGAKDVPGLIDELPILAILATQADGKSVIRGASELRVKESDRIAAVCEGLAALGVKVKEFPDGLEISGPCRLRGGKVDSRHDHRIAMAFSIAGLFSEGTVHISGSGSVAISYPEFFRDLRKLCK